MWRAMWCCGSLVRLAQLPPNVTAKSTAKSTAKRKLSAPCWQYSWRDEVSSVGERRMVRSAVSDQVRSYSPRQLNLS